MKTDSLNRCPNCGGPADNGHDRCYPPNPYFCTKCMIIRAAASNTDECRNAFEQWAANDKFFNSKKVKGMYIDSHVNVAWKIWQVAWSKARNGYYTGTPADAARECAGND